MQQCWMTMHYDAHDQVLAAFNIWDVTTRVKAKVKYKQINFVKTKTNNQIH
jgi:hypothetical protein